ncbi:calcium:proton antiporter [Alteraurantiacibacter buctensis]|uniref:Ionic transporter y4hA n=1 Tax=Alteraurantiacibacter buctensis TaxID=1503981 RepID=A0A844YTN7_9SPHN|nr:ionic transporter y4hA [Alteraurantiacibacter buctensis]MXO70482.1 ionic transporter y4hA [Alteraurantiacibacter buctensis]
MPGSSTPLAHPLRRPFGLPAWTVIVPLLGLVALTLGSGGLFSAIKLALLGAAIMAAVYHAEVLAHYLGEPFGTLVLALAVTVIEVSLIVSIMLSEGAGAQALARDTLIAAIMITVNGIMGLCLLAGGRRHHKQNFTRSGVSAGLAMLATLSVLTLILPNYTVSERGPFYTDAQLIFVAVVSLAVYATFVVAQTIRHREDFLHVDPAVKKAVTHAPVVRSQALAAGLSMVVTLVVVVLLAKKLSPVIESGVAAIGAPQALVGIIIAALVLAPEGFAALAAARRNAVQTSINLAIGSALASIGLTIPAVAVASLAMGLELELGLSMRSTVLLALTLLVATLTFAQGRTTFVQGVIHLVIFASYLFLTIFP